MAGPGRFELTQEQASLCPWLARNYDALRLTLRVTGGGKDLKRSFWRVPPCARFEIVDNYGP
jgi:hypothetical protein